MRRARTAVLTLLAVLAYLLVREEAAVAGAVPWVVAVVALRIEFLGLVDLVSDRTSRPGHVHLLMPNATNPKASWVPEVLRFNPQHFPRLLLRNGTTVHPDSDVTAGPSPHPADDGLLPVDLNGRHVTVASTMTPPAIEVDRMTVGNPNEGSVSTVNYLANMEALAQAAVPSLGGVSQSLLQELYTEAPARISARLVLDGGRLVTGDLWKEENQPYVEIDFKQKPGDVAPLYRQYLARSLVLTADLVEPARLTVRPLNQTQGAEDLVLSPNSNGVVDLVVTNTELDLVEDEPHFIAHYLIRDGFENLTAVRLPDMAWGVAGAGSDPQCSPADNGG